MRQVFVGMRLFYRREGRCRFGGNSGAGRVVNNVQSSRGDSRSNALNK